MVDASSFSQDEFPFDWVKTRDGSWTLKPQIKGSEWMHSLAGAYSESQYVYGQSLRAALKQFKAKNLDSQESFKIISVGLGLGYVEWIAVLECLKAQVKFEIYTFESEVELKAKFLSELKTQTPFKYLKEAFINDYPKELWTQALEKLKQNLNSSEPCLKLHPGLTPASLSQIVVKAHIIFYDAYSSKTQSELWETSFLTNFLEAFASLECCTFSTYACTSELKRILKSLGFEIQKKKGFANKRESTLALLF